MKRIISIAIVLFSMAFVSNASIEVGGISYIIENGEACVTQGEYTGDVSIPESITVDGTTYPVTSIGQYAFRYRSGLTSIEIPGSVTSIGAWAFYYCTGLFKLSIGNCSNLHIGFQAFSSCSSLRYVMVPEITDWLSISFVDISSNPCSNGATLCVGNKPITSLEVPEGITAIRNYAFAGCQFSSVTLPSSLTSIGNGAFQECSKIKNLIVPNSVASICDEAFYLCHQLSDIHIPNTIQSIGKGAFRSCYSLKSLDFWPKSITELPESIFEGCVGLTDVSIPEGITKLGNKAFYYCTKLADVTIPESVAEFGTDVFVGCESLASVTWNAENCSDFSASHLAFGIGYNPISIIFGGKVVKVPAYLCKDCNKLKKVQISNSVKTIGGYAFCNTGVSEVILGNSVEKIADRAFSDCKYLEEIVIPNSVDTIGRRVFGNDRALKNVTLGTAVKSIGVGAFSECGQLTSIGFPASLTQIGAYAFKATGLTAVSLPNSVKEIGYQAFLDCSSLASVELGNSVKTIDANAFSGTKITNITIPATVTTMGTYPFPETLTSMEWNAINCTISSGFLSKGSLSSIIFGDGVETIPAYMCKEQTGLSEITFPASVKSIGVDVLIGCSGLKKVTSHIAKPMNVSLGLFDDQYATLPLYVPKGKTEAYLSTLDWSFFANIIEMEGSELGGDLNDDGSVDGGDVSIMLEMVLAGGVTDAQKAVADLNGDGDVDGGDVSILLEMVLSGD